MSFVIRFAVQHIIAPFLNLPVVWENNFAFRTWQCATLFTPQGGSHNVQVGPIGHMALIHCQLQMSSEKCSDWAGSIPGMRNIMKKEKTELTSGLSEAGALVPCTDCPSSWDIGGGDCIGASLRTSLCPPYVEADSWRPRASNLNITKAMRPKATSPMCPEVKGNCGPCEGSTLASYNTPSNGSRFGRVL
jgi:hypothetical protein